MLGTHILPDIISVDHLARLIGSDHAPLVLDVRREAAFHAASSVLPAARRALHTAITAQTLGPAPRGVIVYCVHGHNVSQLATASLRAEGVSAARLEGGIEAWIAAGQPVIARAPDAEARYSKGTTWVTRRRPKIDRVACPWFIRRFVDDRARFLFVDKDHVLSVAAETGGIAFDVEGAPITHDGPRCSFDTLLDRYHVSDEALRRLADVVRGADTNVLSAAPEAGGLLAISLGLSALESDDHIMLQKGFHLYDGLYAYLRHAHSEPHNWPPKA
jgi:rhodanese-related sulfurtransferase